MIYWRPGILRCPRVRTPIEPSARDGPPQRTMPLRGLTRIWPKLRG